MMHMFHKYWANEQVTRYSRKSMGPRFRETWGGAVSLDDAEKVSQPLRGSISFTVS